MTRFLASLSAALVLCTGVAHAQSVTLAWDANTEPDVAGYQVLYGDSSRQYTNTATVGNVTQWTVNGLTAGRTYYFAVRAVNTAGLVSALSAEVSTTVASLPITSRSELLWRNLSTGAIASWVLDGPAQLYGQAVGPGAVADLNWKIVGMGDFNADRERDVVWQHADGSMAVWLMRGSTLLDGRLMSPGRIDPVWRIVAVADMNADGNSDLLWHHSTDGYVAVWYMNGTSLRDGQLLDPGQVPVLDWKIVGTGDFNADGKPDLLWRHATEGRLAVWLMDGARQLEGRALSPEIVSDLDWKVAAIVDINADRRADIIWQHADGRLAVWVMNGTTLMGGMPLSPAQVADLNWRISTGR